MPTQTTVHIFSQCETVTCWSAPGLLPLRYSSSRPRSDPYMHDYVTPRYPETINWVPYQQCLSCLCASQTKISWSSFAVLAMNSLIHLTIVGFGSVTGSNQVFRYLLRGYWNFLCELGKKSLTVEINRVCASLGASRFKELVDANYFTNVKFFRVIKTFMAQFGTAPDPTYKIWNNKPIADDPATKSNEKGK